MKYKDYYKILKSISNNRITIDWIIPSRLKFDNYNDDKEELMIKFKKNIKNKFEDIVINSKSIQFFSKNSFKDNILKILELKKEVKDKCKIKEINDLFL